MSCESPSLKELGNMSVDDFRRYLEKCEKTQLIEWLLTIREKRAIRWEDRAILQLVEKSPLTLWASNKAYRIVLWAGSCTETYNRNLIGEQFPEIMSIYERAQAMEDSLRVIEADENSLKQLLVDFKNYYTKDLQGSRAGFNLVTNSMQLVDDETGEKYYAEIGLPIDLEKALDEHRCRQVEFDQCVKAFKKAVQSLNRRFDEGIDIRRTRINDERGLNSKQRSELRRRIRDKCEVIIANLRKCDKAFDFEQFLQENEDAIDSVLREVDYEIENAIKKIETINVSDQQENPMLLKRDIEHKMEIVQITFDEETTKRTTAPKLSAGEECIRSAAIDAFQNKRDEFIRELTGLKECVDSATGAALALYRRHLSEIELEMRTFIDNVNNPEEVITNGKKK